MKMKRFEDIPKEELLTKYAIFKVSDISVIIDVVYSMDEALNALNLYGVGHYSCYEYQGSSRHKFDYWLRIPENRYFPITEYDLSEIIELRRKHLL